MVIVTPEYTELAVVRPRPKGEQSQALGTYLGGSQSMKVRCSPGYFLIFLVRSYILFFVLPWRGRVNSIFFVLLILFYFSYCVLFSFEHFASSVLVACLRYELHPSLVRPLASTWCGIYI